MLNAPSSAYANLVERQLSAGLGNHVHRRGDRGVRGYEHLASRDAAQLEGRLDDLKRADGERGGQRVEQRDVDPVRLSLHPNLRVTRRVDTHFLFHLLCLVLEGRQEHEGLVHLQGTPTRNDRFASPRGDRVALVETGHLHVRQLNRQRRNALSLTLRDEAYVVVLDAAAHVDQLAQQLIHHHLAVLSVTPLRVPPPRLCSCSSSSAGAACARCADR